MLAKQPLKKGDSFKGKRIGAESGPLSSYLLARFMDKFDIDEAQLEIKYVDIPGQASMWDSDEIDLLITYDPIRSQLKAKGAFEIFTSKEIPNEIIDVFLIREEKLESQKDNLKAFVSGWFKAVKDLNSGNPRVFEFIGMREKLSADVVREIFTEISVPGYSENLIQLSGENKEFMAGFDQHEKIMLDKKLMATAVDKKALITNKALLLIEPQ